MTTASNSQPEGADAAPPSRIALWWTSPGHAEIARIDQHEEHARAHDGHTTRLKTLFTGLSHGTERIVGLGQVPEALWDAMRCPHQRGSFAFPVCYGYSLVGEDEAGNMWHALHPHSSYADVDAAWLTRVPGDVPAERATLLPNVETALNAVWAGEVLPGDRCVVVGGGVVGLAVAKIAQAASGVPVTVIDPVAAKRAVAETWGCEVVDPVDTRELEQRDASFDVVFHTSGTESGLRSALGLAADDSPIVEVSWYGDKEPAAPLGAAFHYRRLRLVSAQVAAVPPKRRARWTTRRRREHAMRLLRDSAWQTLIERRVPFAEAPLWLADNLWSGELLHTVFDFASAADG